MSWKWEYAFGAEEAARSAPSGFLTAAANITDQAADWAREQKKDKGRDGFGRMGSLHPLTSCPWCG